MSKSIEVIQKELDDLAVTVKSLCDDCDLYFMELVVTEEQVKIHANCEHFGPKGVFEVFKDRDN